MKTTKLLILKFFHMFKISDDFVTTNANIIFHFRLVRASLPGSVPQKVGSVLGRAHKF